MKASNKTVEKLGYIPEAIMLHVPENFFGHGYDEAGFANAGYDEAYKVSYETYSNQREQVFRRFYESMGNGGDEDCFYHFISTCPAKELADGIMHVYVCFRGKVQYKAILVKFMVNEIVDLPTYKHLTPRNWCITTGPVEKPPEDILLKDVWKGARQGFRYTKNIF